MRKRFSKIWAVSDNKSRWRADPPLGNDNAMLAKAMRHTCMRFLPSGFVTSGCNLGVVKV